jgi:hypothetical protein
VSEPNHRLSLAYARTGRSRWGTPAKGADLLRRYPQLDEDELADLIAIVQRMAAPEIALAMADEDLGLQLEAFCNDHRPWLGSPAGSYAVIAVLMVGLALLSWVASAT